ncbi:MAG TPA: serine/threonine-protein kinase, partial [Gemmatimonadales bacterium]|nr:serine/threonine-protein kinase [Gemmatimonadales bacterium]
MGVVIPPGPPAPTPEPPRPGESADALQRALQGRYVLKRKLGQGGMGVVFQAWESALERMVALKMLPATGASPELRQRFLKEARIAAGLSHPNIVPIYTVDEAGPWLFYTMAYVHGENLHQRVLTRGPLGPGETARILREVAWAVDYAHEQGVLHRDLKPQNILLEEPGDRVLVTDFGIARLLTEAPPAEGWYPLGTAAYLSPERAAGLPADQRSDIYSLGIMAHRMAAGQEPFTGTVEQILEQQLRAPVPSLKVLGLNLDTTLSEAAGRCLAKEPLERFQVARELAAALSLAPELASDLPLVLRRFLRRVKVATQSRYVSVGLGIWGLLVLGQAIEDGNWDRAALGAGLLASVLALPLVSVFQATRNLLKAGYGHAKIIHSMLMDRDRQEEELGVPLKDRPRGFWATLWLRAAQTCAVLFLLGFVAAIVAPSLPEAPVMISMAGGAVLGALAGFFYMGADLARHQLVGQRWRKVMEKEPWGRWWVKLAGLGLKRLPGDPLRAVLSPPPAD